MASTQNNSIDSQAYQKSMDIQAYLDRIGFQGKVSLHANTLANLQKAHVMTVPYENIDIMNRIPLSLEIPDLYKKIVTKHRGGYCFELNGLFAWLLESLGFKVTQYMSRFLRDETEIPMRRHRVLKVEADGMSWLCDVGVGGSCPLYPLKMVEGLEQTQGKEIYRLVNDSFLGWVVEEKKKEKWMQYYSFTEEVQLPLDYVMPSYWCENAADSIFIQSLMISIRTLNGRITVSDEEFRIFSEDGVEVFTPKNSTEHADALKKWFGIVLE